MSSKLRLLALAASVTVPAVLSLPAAAAGYFDTPEAPLIPPTLYDTGSAQATIARQQASGYFPTAGAPLVPPTEYDTGSAAATAARQHASGYFGEAGAPLVAPTTTEH
jgi:hypothetical protein